MTARKNISLSKIASKFGVSKIPFTEKYWILKRITLKRMLKKPCLNKHNKTLRLKQAKKMMFCGGKQLSRIFSDEKKRNIYEPDGYKFQWIDLRSFFSRQQGVKSVMTWGGFGFNG